MQKLPPVLQTVTVTGGMTQFAPPVEFPPVMPCGPPYPPNTGITGQLYNRATGTLVDVGVGAMIYFAPGEYCFSSIQIAVGSTIRVTGPTRISLTAPEHHRRNRQHDRQRGDLRIESSIVSPLPMPPGIVPALTIVGVAGNVSMVINAPRAIVTFAAVATSFFGQIVAGMCQIAVRTPHVRHGARQPAPLSPRLERAERLPSRVGIC